MLNFALFWDESKFCRFFASCNADFSALRDREWKRVYVAQFSLVFCVECTCGTVMAAALTPEQENVSSVFFITVEFDRTTNYVVP